MQQTSTHHGDITETFEIVTQLEMHDLRRFGFYMDPAHVDVCDPAPELRQHYANVALWLIRHPGTAQRDRALAALEHSMLLAYRSIEILRGHPIGQRGMAIGDTSPADQDLTLTLHRRDQALRAAYRATRTDDSAMESNDA